MAHHHNTAQHRLDRKNTRKQVQTAKRGALATSTRIFDGVDGAPRIIAVIPLCEDVRPAEAVSALAAAAGEDIEGVEEDRKIWRMRVRRFRTSLMFLPVQYGRSWDALDAAKASDYVLLLLSPTLEVSRHGDTLLRTLQAQGLPNIVSAVPPNLLTTISGQSSRIAILKSLLSFMQYFDPSQARVYDLSASVDSLNALRSLVEGRPGEVRWREGRSWVVGEEVEWEDGVLRVTGVIRGARLSASGLVYIPEFGDYQISKIVSAPIHCCKSGQSAAMEVDEQTWENGTTPKQVTAVPKGINAYQASRRVDESEGDKDDVQVDVSDQGSDVAGGSRENVRINALTDTEDGGHGAVVFQDLDTEEEERQFKDWRNRAQEERDTQQFPDELDTPQDIPARMRFARYRGMRSFRTSPWDPYESLPGEYAKICEFEDFKCTERDVQIAGETDGIEPGTRVTVFIQGAPQEASTSDHLPIVIHCLLQHEHKKTVLHFTVQRNTEYKDSVRSKDPLILCYGPRRLRVKPVYSQHSQGGKGVNNVHKLERFLWHGMTVVASVYGPVMFGNQPCALLRETEDAQAPELVAMGSFLNSDTTRIIAKRIVLTGHPFKIHRKSATVRYMFFNPDDVQYFKPIQLFTKQGRTGHIRESLGTHGYFKAYFDGPINQMDTVCMALYKRVFPSWSEPWQVGIPSNSVANGDEDVVMS